MSLKLWPSENDIAPTTGDGRSPTEENLRQWAKMLNAYLTSRIGPAVFQGPGAFLGGFEVTGSSGLDVTLANGIAWIDGYYVEEDAAGVHTLTDDAYNFLYLRLTKTADKVTGVSWQIDTGTYFEEFGTPPDDALLAYCFLTAAGIITGTWNYQSSLPAAVSGSYLGDGTNARNIELGFLPKLVYVAQRGSVGVRSWSELPTPLVSGSLKGMALVEVTAGGDLIGASTNDNDLRPELITTPVLGFTVDGASGVSFTARRHRRGSKAWTPGSIAAGTSVTTTVTVAGVAGVDLDPVSISLPVHQANGDVSVDGWVSADDTVTAIVRNHGSGPVSLGADTLTATCVSLASATVSLNTGFGGTAGGGGASTITMTGASSTDDEYNGLPVVVTAGTGAGQRRTVVDYDGSTKVATVDTPWDVAPDATSVYHVGEEYDFLAIA